MKRFAKIASGAVLLLVVVASSLQVKSLTGTSAAQSRAAGKVSAAVKTAATERATAQPITSTKALNAAVDAALAEYPGFSSAVAFVDVSTGASYDYGDTSTIYKAASTAKVLAAVDYLHEVELGNASLAQTLDGMTAQQAIQQMIEISDNNAWAAINNFLGSQQDSYAASIGMTSFVGGEYNTMTAHDEAKLLTQLAGGKLLNNADRTLLYGFMSNTDSTNLIQAATPTGAIVYHKYGELWGNLHDAAIINYQGKTYVLVIYTNNPDGTMDASDQQVNLIHAITAAVFKNL